MSELRDTYVRRGFVAPEFRLTSAELETLRSACDALLIERDWYQLGRWGLDGAGRCNACGEPVAGHFEGPPGQFGSRRIPVRLDLGK